MKGADALSTVALALAILSFTSQLIIFAVQTGTSTQQLNQSQSLNTQTNALVAEVRADVAGTKSLLTDHFKELLRAAITKSIPEAEKAAIATNSSSPNEQLTNLLSNLEQAIERVSTSVSSAPTPQHAQSPRISTEDEQIVSMMTSWPSEAEAHDVLPIYEQIPEASRGSFAIASYDELRSRQNGSRPGLSPIPSDTPLIKAGLEELISVDGEDQLRLTELGRRVGRLTTAEGPRPSYLSEADLLTYNDVKNRISRTREATRQRLREAMEAPDASSS